MVEVCIVAGGVPGYLSESFHIGLYTSVALLSMSPVVYTVLFVLYQICKRRRHIMCKIKSWRKGYKELLPPAARMRGSGYSSRFVCQSVIHCVCHALIFADTHHWFLKQ